MQKWLPYPLFLLFSAFVPGDCEIEPLSASAPFPVGVAIDTEKLKTEEKYWTTALKHFNSFTPEMVMKADHVHPAQGKFNFFEIDQLMRFCGERKIRLHGHTLVWHESLPSWMIGYEGTNEDWEKMLADHVSTIVRHCAGRVNSWDVVNEAFTDDGRFRKNIWLKNLGPGYIETAFRLAREADPRALLFYNDYSLELPGPKLSAVLSALAPLKEKGLVDGIGLQMHVKLDQPSREQLQASLREIVKAGFVVHFSEMDVRVNGEENLFKAGKKLAEMQRLRVQQIVTDYLAIPSHMRYGITLWGVSDGDSWLSADHVRAKPMLFDERYRPKPAFCGFMDALKNN